MSLSRAVRVRHDGDNVRPELRLPVAPERLRDRGRQHALHPGSPLALRDVAADPETKRGPNEPVNDLYLR